MIYWYRSGFGALFLLLGASLAQTHAAGIFYETTVNPEGPVSNAKVRAFFTDRDANGVLLPDNSFTLTLQYVSASFSAGSFDNGGVLTGFTWTTAPGFTLAIGPPDTIGVVTGAHTNVVSSGSKDGYNKGDVIYPAGYNVSNWWGYVPTAVGAAGGGIFGDGTAISNAAGSMQGVDYGLVPVGAIAGGNGGLGAPSKRLIEADGTLDGSNVIPTSVVFTFKVTSGQSAAATFLGFSSGKFFFGSNLDEYPGGPPTLIPDEIDVIPEPGSIAAMLSLASFGLGAFVVRRRRAKKLAA